MYIVSLNYVKAVSEVEKYLEEQSKYILERVNNHDKLYIEFGGKLLGDLHAKRVLPGFDENAKIKVLNKLKDQIEVIICVYAGDIERNKIRGDFGITYDMDVFRLIDDLRENDLKIKKEGIYVDNINTCVEMVNQGLGWAIVPEICLKNFKGQIKPLVFKNGEAFTRSTYLLYSNSVSKLPQVREFIKIIQNRK